VLHYPDEAKNKEDFLKVKKSKLAQKDYDFGGTVFPKGTVDFDGFEFDANANFTGAIFSDNVSFRGAQFSGEETDFSLAKFGSTQTDFSYAEFSGSRTDFTSAEFHGDTTAFYEAKFGGNETLFHKAEFVGAKAGFGAAIFIERVSFSGVRFEHPQDFFSTVFKGEVDFSNATFDKSIRLRGKVPEVALDGPQPRQDAGLPDTQFALNGIRIEEPDASLFQTVALRSSWLVNVVDVRKLRLINVRWQEVTLEDELENLAETDAPHELLARACRELAANAEENRDYPLANEFHYWAMDALRKDVKGHRRVRRKGVFEGALLRVCEPIL
jgi:hypothetical protein